MPPKGNATAHPAGGLRSSTRHDPALNAKARQGRHGVENATKVAKEQAGSQALSLSQQSADELGGGNSQSASQQTTKRIKQLDGLSQSSRLQSQSLSQSQSQSVDELANPRERGHERSIVRKAARVTLPVGNHPGDEDESEDDDRPPSKKLRTGQSVIRNPDAKVLVSNTPLAQNDELAITKVQRLATPDDRLRRTSTPTVTEQQGRAASKPAANTHQAQSRSHFPTKDIHATRSSVTPEVRNNAERQSFQDALSKNHTRAAPAPQATTTVNVGEASEKEAFTQLELATRRHFLSCLNVDTACIGAVREVFPGIRQTTPLFAKALKKSKDLAKNWKQRITRSGEAWVLRWLKLPEARPWAGVHDFKQLKDKINEGFQLHWLEEMFKFAVNVVDFDKMTTRGKMFLRYAFIYIVTHARLTHLHEKSLAYSHLSKYARSHLNGAVDGLVHKSDFGKLNVDDFPILEDPVASRFRGKRITVDLDADSDGEMGTEYLDGLEDENEDEQDDTADYD